jgi:hypothetical protein
VVIYANVPAVATSIEAVADEKADEKARLKKAEKARLVWRSCASV